MKTGITLGVVLKHYSIKDGIKKLADVGFDSIDFPLNYFSVAKAPKDSINYIMYTDKWKDFCREIADNLSEYGMEAYQIHALWGLYTDLAEYIPPEEQYKRQFEAASIIGSRQLVFHPIPPTVKMNSKEDRDRVIDYNIRWFRELVPAAEYYGVNMTLENTFTHCENRPGDGVFPFVDAETMTMLADGIGSKNVSFCLDTGHANVEHGNNFVNMVSGLGKRLKVLHVHDNFGLREPLLSSDLHMFPGFGASALESLCAELGKNGFDGVLSLEPSHLNMPAKRLDIVLDCAHKMAEYYGDIVDENRIADNRDK